MQVARNIQVAGRAGCESSSSVIAEQKVCQHVASSAHCSCTTSTGNPRRSAAVSQHGVIAIGVATQVVSCQVPGLDKAPEISAHTKGVFAANHCERISKL